MTCMAGLVMSPGAHLACRNSYGTSGKVLVVRSIDNVVLRVCVKGGVEHVFPSTTLIMVSHDFVVGDGVE